jgi:diacylglycerol kinase (ATP)
MTALWRQSKGGVVPGIGVVTNPRSRQNRRNPRLARQLAYILGEKGELQQPSDLDALAAAAKRFRDHGIEILCINGGDGTMHKALTAMVKAYEGQPLPKIAILRGGTMNTVAHGLKIRGTPAEILDYVVQRYHADSPFPTVRRHLLEVEGQHYGFLFGNGLVARFLEVYYEGSEPSPAKAAWLMVRAVVSSALGGRFAERLTKPFVGEARVDGTLWKPRRWLMVAAGTVDDIGLGFRPFWRAPLHLGRMHVVGTFGPNAMTIVRELWRIFRARPPEGPEWVEQVGSELVLHADEPIGYMIDGDFHRGGNTVTVRIGPPVEFIVPEKGW